MATAEIESPTFEYLGCSCLPSTVRSVITKIQKHMMDEMSNSRRPQILPNMPKHFLCSEVIEKEKMMEIAGEDLAEDKSKKLHCVQIIIPFAVYPITGELANQIDTTSPSFSWSGNAISFCEVSESNAKLVAVRIKGNLVKVKVRSGEDEVKRELRFFPISSDKEDRNNLPSPSLKKFLKSPLVVEETAGQCLLSSYKLTISWLRSRLHKALNKYREMEKDVEVIATIKQKTDGPLFLRLHVVEVSTSYRNKVTEYDVLIAMYPALRVTPCELAVAVVGNLDAIPSQFENKNGRHCLWRIIRTCRNTLPEHRHQRTSTILDVSSQLTLSETNVEESEEESEKPVTDEKSLYKTSIDNVRQMTSSQRQQCEMCQNPASSMLLEYYYQHGYIPDEEMSEAYSFVWEILSFLERSVKADQKPNGPQILEFLESGSVSEKLKVVQPDEFDVMIRIDLPRSTDDYTFISHEMFPTGFAICQVKRSKSFSRGLKRCFRKSDGFGHCLAPEQLAFGWLYGKLERAVNEYKNLKESSCKANLKLRQSGPALLLEITPTQPKSKLPHVISVDLVLALKLSKDDSRYAVAKRAKEEHFYKMVAEELDSTDERSLFNSDTNSPVTVDSEEGNLNSAGSSQDETNPSRIQESNPDIEEEETVDNTKELGRKNLKYLWRISYSAQEKQYLEDVREIQQKENVNGCQDICLMVLKTICTREILKQEESVICHKLSSYILKTALFHVLSKSDLIHDWKMECLADRYVDLLDELSNWWDLPHFFFNNASYLRKFFPEEDWCQSTNSKNLLSELHATLKIHLFDRFVQIASSFKKFKDGMENKVQAVQFAENQLAYHAVLSKMGNQVPEEVIHPPFRTFKSKEKSRRSLIAAEVEDIRVSKAVRAERKSGWSDARRTLQREAANKKIDHYEAWLREVRELNPSPQQLFDLICLYFSENSNDPDEV